MCLGAQARAANKAAKRNYEFELQKREREWMQTLSMTGVEHLQYEQTLDASNLGLGNVYSEIQEKHNELFSLAREQGLTDWKAFLQNNKGADLAASGRLGRSTDRLTSLELGEYLKKGNDQATKLTDATIKLSKEGAKAAAQTKQQQLQAFTNVAFLKNPDIVPPKPVFQNVGYAAMMDALSIGTSVGTMIAASDRELKENIKKIGESISGLGIYKFNYIGKVKQYIGTMSDEVKNIFPEAVVIMNNGYEAVRYDLIDVQFKEAV